LETIKKIVVTGAGGFIGHHLVKYLKHKGYWVRGVDLKVPEFEKSQADEFLLFDLRDMDACLKACDGMEEVYQLAADMGGIGYITYNSARIFRNNTLINTHMIDAAQNKGVKKYLFTSSACVYPQYLQGQSEVKPLKEEDAYPADAEPGYGWEKLYAEMGCGYYHEEYGMNTRIVRFHNVFGPYGSYDGGKEKSPAAICRKIALAREGDEIEIWGDGKQTRSYCYIDDCVEGLFSLMQSDYHEPVNLGQDRLVTIDELVDMVAKISEKNILKRYDLSKPQGVRGRNADISLIKKIIGWEPRVSLEKGLAETYQWICGKIAE
jgi:nucleoside-diphosphate-sugar epimerase